MRMKEREREGENEMRADMIDCGREGEPERVELKSRSVSETLWDCDRSRLFLYARYYSGGNSPRL